MNQPFKPPPPPKGKPLRGPDAPDDLSIPVLTERVNVPPRAVKPVPALDLDIELPPVAAATPVAPSIGAPGAVPATAAAHAPEFAVTPAPAGGATSGLTSGSTVGTTSASAGASSSTMRPRFGGTTAGPGAERIDSPSPGAPWGRMEIELREAILNDLAQRLPQEVEAIVRRHMTNAIDTMVERLAGDTRIAVAASLREIVGHAVRAELERLRAEKR